MIAVTVFIPRVVQAFVNHLEATMTERRAQSYGKQPDELTADQLDNVTAGVTVTKVVDVSSPTLSNYCANGKHITSAATHS